MTGNVPKQTRVPPGHAWTCRTCGRLVLGEGNYGISPDALCTCCSHDRRPEPPRLQPGQLDGLSIIEQNNIASGYLTGGLANGPK